MDSVFISSVQRDFGDIREAARRGIESLGLRALMAETVGASAVSPQRALLDLVGRADVLLLILGPRYSKPTEDEFDEARRLAKPILVLRQAGGADPDQDEFVGRVAGGWKGGRLWGSFNDASDIGFAVVQAVASFQSQSVSADAQPAAQERARELVVGSENRGFGAGTGARIAQVPLVSEPLLDAVALGRSGLGERIAALAREHRLVPQSVGIETKISRTGISVHAAGGYANAESVLQIGADGSITASFSVAGDDQFGTSRVDPARLREGIEAAGAFARSAWEEIDEREAVQQVAVAVAILDAQHKVFGPSTGRNSIQMGGFGMQSVVVVPDPARVVRRAEIGSSGLTDRLVAEVGRAFADAGAVEK